LPPVVTAAYASQQAIKENNAAVAAGGPGILLGYTPTTEYESEDYSIFDLSFGWNLTDKLSLRGGITNLFDTWPEVVGATTGYPTPASGGAPITSICGSLGSPPGCLNPTVYSATTSGTYSAGYYDILGRRYFVGMSMQF
jgi:outer membrane receptor for ferrienterochelin and colicin